MTDNVFSKTIPDLQRWQPGQPVSARRLDKRDEAIKALYRGVGEPKQKVTEPRGGGTASEIRGGKVVSVGPGMAFVGIQFVTKGEDGNIVNDGEPQVVEVWPDRTAVDYARFVDQDDVLMVMQFLGEWRVRWHARITIAVPRGPFGACV